MSRDGQKILLIGTESRSENFESILKQIFPTEIPPKYIDEVQVDFIDGSSISLNTLKISTPLPMSDGKAWREIIKPFDFVSQVTVVVDISKIEHFVNSEVSNILEAYC